MTLTDQSMENNNLFFLNLHHQKKLGRFKNCTNQTNTICLFHK